MDGLDIGQELVLCVGNIFLSTEVCRSAQEWQSVEVVWRLKA